MNSRKPRPRSDVTRTATSRCTQPSTAGPTRIPPTISSTTGWTLTAGSKPRSSGTTTATRPTISRLLNEITVDRAGHRRLPCGGLGARSGRWPASEPERHAGGDHLLACQLGKPNDMTRGRHGVDVRVAERIAITPPGTVPGRRHSRERGRRVQDRQTPLDPFVGRTAELARVAEVITRVKEGQPWLVAIEGDPGIGKTSPGAPWPGRRGRHQGAVGPGRSGRGGSGLRDRRPAAASGRRLGAGGRADRRFFIVFRGCPAAGGGGRTAGWRAGHRDR